MLLGERVVAEEDASASAGIWLALVQDAAVDPRLDRFGVSTFDAFSHSSYSAS